MIQLVWAYFAFGIPVCLFVSSHPSHPKVYDFGDNLRHKRSINVYIYPGQSSNITLVFNSPSSDHMRIPSSKTHHGHKEKDRNQSLGIGHHSISNPDRIKILNTNDLKNVRQEIRLESSEGKKLSALGDFESNFSVPEKSFIKQVNDNQTHNSSHNVNAKRTIFLKGSVTDAPLTAVHNETDQSYLEQSTETPIELPKATNTSSIENIYLEPHILKKVLAEAADHPPKNSSSHYFKKNISAGNNQSGSEILHKDESNDNRKQKTHLTAQAHNATVNIHSSTHNDSSNNNNNKSPQNLTLQTVQEVSLDSVLPSLNGHLSNQSLTNSYSAANAKSLSQKLETHTFSENQQSNVSLAVKEDNVSKAILPLPPSTENTLKQPSNVDHRNQKNFSQITNSTSSDTFNQINSTGVNKDSQNQLHINQSSKNPVFSDDLGNQPQPLHKNQSFQATLSNTSTTVKNMSPNENITSQNLTTSLKDSDDRKHSKHVEHNYLNTLANISPSEVSENVSTHSLSEESSLKNNSVGDHTIQQNHTHLLENGAETKSSGNNVSKDSLLVGDNVSNMTLTEKPFEQNRSMQIQNTSHEVTTSGKIAGGTNQSINQSHHEGSSIEQILAIDNKQHVKIVEEDKASENNVSRLSSVKENKSSDQNVIKNHAEIRHEDYDQKHNASDQNVTGNHAKIRHKDYDQKHNSSVQNEFLKSNVSAPVFMNQSSPVHAFTKHVSVGNKDNHARHYETDNSNDNPVFNTTYTTGLNNLNTSIKFQHELQEISSSGKISKSKNPSTNRSHYDRYSIEHNDNKIHVKPVSKNTVSENNEPYGKENKYSDRNFTENHVKDLEHEAQNHKNKSSEQNEFMKTYNSEISSDNYKLSKNQYFPAPVKPLGSEDNDSESVEQNKYTDSNLTNATFSNFKNNYNLSTHAINATSASRKTSKGTNHSSNQPLGSGIGHNLAGNEERHFKITEAGTTTENYIRNLSLTIENNALDQNVTEKTPTFYHEDYNHQNYSAVKNQSLEVLNSGNSSENKEDAKNQPSLVQYSLENSSVGNKENHSTNLEKVSTDNHVFYTPLAVKEDCLDRTLVTQPSKVSTDLYQNQSEEAQEKALTSKTLLNVHTNLSENVFPDRFLINTSASDGRHDKLSNTSQINKLSQFHDASLVAKDNSLDRTSTQQPPTLTSVSSFKPNRSLVSEPNPLGSLAAGNASNVYKSSLSPSKVNLTSSQSDRYNHTQIHTKERSTKDSLNRAPSEIDEHVSNATNSLLTTNGVGNHSKIAKEETSFSHTETKVSNEIGKNQPSQYTSVFQRQDHVEKPIRPKMVEPESVTHVPPKLSTLPDINTISDDSLVQSLSSRANQSESTKQDLLEKASLASQNKGKENFENSNSSSYSNKQVPQSNDESQSRTEQSQETEAQQGSLRKDNFNKESVSNVPLTGTSLDTENEKESLETQNDATELLTEELHPISEENESNHPVHHEKILEKIAVLKQLLANAHADHETQKANSLEDILSQIINGVTKVTETPQTNQSGNDQSIGLNPKSTSKLMRSENVASSQHTSRFKTNSFEEETLSSPEQALQQEFGMTRSRKAQPVKHSLKHMMTRIKEGNGYQQK